MARFNSVAQEWEAMLGRSDEGGFLVEKILPFFV